MSYRGSGLNAGFTGIKTICKKNLNYYKLVYNGVNHFKNGIKLVYEKRVKWSSSKKSVATVTAKGVV